MGHLDDALVAAISAAGVKPDDTDTQANKKNYNQRLSTNLPPNCAAAV